jgi:hypothetical protein
MEIREAKSLSYTLGIKILNKTIRAPASVALWHH